MSASTLTNVLLAILLVLAIIALMKCYGMRAAAVGGASARASQALAKLDVFKRLEPIEWFAKWYYIAVAGLICIFALSLAARKGEVSWEALADLLLGASVSFVVAVAATALGCLLGFLFGIPKSLQRGAAPPPQQQPASGAPSGSAKDAAAGGGTAARTSGPGVRDQYQPRGDIGLADQDHHRSGSGPVSDLSLLSLQRGLVCGVVHRPDGITIDTTQTGKLEYQSGLASPFLFAIILACLVASCLFAYLETRTRLAQLFMEQKRDEDGPAPEFRDKLTRDGSSETLQSYLWPGGVYDDERRKTLNNLLAELGISRDVRLILVGEDSAEFRKLLIGLAEKKGYR